MTLPVSYGTLIAACDQIVRSASTLDNVSGADLRHLAAHMQDASLRVRLLASCHEADAVALRPRRPSSHTRRAA